MEEYGDFLAEGLSLGFDSGMKKATNSMIGALQGTLSSMEALNLNATNSFEAPIDYEKLAQMTAQGIYIDGRLIGRALKEQGVVFG